MLLGFLAFIAGMILVIKGADWLVDGASSLARRFGVSELAIGLTIVAFGTSMPELTVNLFSSFNGASDIAIGNIIGSNIANILLILGITAAIAPVPIQTSTVWKEIPFALLASFLALILANDALLDGRAASELARTDGLALLGFFCIFLWYIAGMAAEEDDTVTSDGHKLPRALLLVAGGLAGLVAGGKLVVNGATAVATGLGVSQALIGFTIVAVGTSVPELATSVMAARKGKTDIAVGNVVGSNIFNVFWILGLSSSIRPLPFHPSFNADLLLAIGSTLLLFYAAHTGKPHRRMLFWKQRKGHVIQTADGWLMLACYAGYMAYLITRG